MTLAPNILSVLADCALPDIPHRVVVLTAHGPAEGVSLMARTGAVPVETFVRSAYGAPACIVRRGEL